MSITKDAAKTEVHDYLIRLMEARYPVNERGRQKQIAQDMGIPPTRVTQLVKGNIELFSLECLALYCARLGAKATIMLEHDSVGLSTVQLRVSK